MPLPSPAFCELSFIFDATGWPHGAATTCAFELGAFNPTGGDMFVLASFCGDLQNEISTTQTTLQEIRVKVGPDATGATYTQSVGVNGGEDAATEMPQVAYLIRKVTPAISQRFSGRMYWPGVAVTDTLDGGNLVTAAQTRINDGLFTFQDALYTSWGMEPKIFPATSSDPRNVSSLQVQSRVATQRRRNRR